jgi:ketosteroid isomerase-like protein
MVRQAADRFYAALRAVFEGDVEPMAAVWSHADDVTYLGPSSSLCVGWEAVLAAWKAQAAMNLKGDIEPVDVHVTLGQDMAATSSYVRGHNFDRAGQRHQVAIRDTNLFRREDGVWKMVGHHSDPLPFIETL